MQLEVTRLALETIAVLRPLVPRIRRHDRSLAIQLVRAAASAALNLGEGEQSDPGTRPARYCNAAGSANETRTALAVAVAWGYLSSAQAEPASRRLDRVVAMLWKLTHGSAVQAPRPERCVAGAGVAPLSVSPPDAAPATDRGQRLQVPNVARPRHGRNGPIGDTRDWHDACVPKRSTRRVGTVCASHSAAREAHA